MYQRVEDEKETVKAVHLKGSDIDVLKLLLGQLLAQFSPVNAETAEHGYQPSSFDPEALTQLARRMLLARRRRTRTFNKCMFGEPAWDMLLALYVSRSSGPRYSVSQLSTLSGSPPTTALRWLDYLAKEQLIVRAPNPTDRRSDFVEMTDKGRTALEQYLSETLQTLA